MIHGFGMRASGGRVVTTCCLRTLDELREQCPEDPVSIDLSQVTCPGPPFTLADAFAELRYVWHRLLQALGLQ